MLVDIYFKFGKDLEKVWRQLEFECDSWVFQSYDWLSHWQKSVGEGCRVTPIILVLMDESNRAVALFPLAMRRVFGIRVLEFLGGALTDYNAPLISKAYLRPNLIKLIWHKVEINLPKHDVRSFVRLPAESCQDENSWPGILGVCFSSVAYICELPKENKFLNQLGTSRVRADSKRQLKRLSLLGEVKFISAHSESDFRKITKSMIDQKSQRYEVTGVRNIFSSELIKDFYLTFPKMLGDGGRLRVTALSLDGKILATHWGILYKCRYYWLMPTYAFQGWDNFSTGRLLLEHELRWAIENELKVFDFTIGEENYKKIWANKTIFIYSHLRYFSKLGMAFVVIHQCISWLKSNSKSKKFITIIVSRYRIFLKNIRWSIWH